MVGDLRGVLDGAAVFEVDGDAVGPERYGNKFVLPADKSTRRLILAMAFRGCFDRRVVPNIFVFNWGRPSMHVTEHVIQGTTPEININQPGSRSRQSRRRTR
jgi:hypothetical protein